MANLEINERDVQRLREIAQREHRPVEEIVSELIDSYTSQTQASVSEYRAKLYAYARRYWATVNDGERLSLTDEQLADLFWCIDPEGVPRLKPDKDKISLPENGLQTFLESVWRDNSSGQIEEPFDYREVLKKSIPAHLIHRMQETNDQSDPN